MTKDIYTMTNEEYDHFIERQEDTIFHQTCRMWQQQLWEMRSDPMVDGEDYYHLENKIIDICGVEYL